MCISVYITNIRVKNTALYEKGRCSIMTTITKEMMIERLEEEKVILQKQIDSAMRRIEKIKSGNNHVNSKILSENALASSEKTIVRNTKRIQAIDAYLALV